MKLKIITSNLGKAEEFREGLKHLDIEIEHCTVGYDEVQSSELREVVLKEIGRAHV